MLVGSLSGQPISRLVAGPVAKLIAEQIPEPGSRGGGRDREDGDRAGAMPVVRSAIFPASAGSPAPEGSRDWAAEAYSEF